MEALLHGWSLLPEVSRKNPGLNQLHCTSGIEARQTSLTSFPNINSVTKSGTEKDSDVLTGVSLDAWQIWQAHSLTEACRTMWQIGFDRGMINDTLVNTVLFKF